ncbi:MAG TPA: hypothetical protein DCG12_13785 [Planctomycetaceae bacterium]|nr:hypothetical protein [Planctomycetaceae bacterium]
MWSGNVTEDSLFRQEEQPKEHGQFGRSEMVDAQQYHSVFIRRLDFQSVAIESTGGRTCLLFLRWQPVSVSNISRRRTRRTAADSVAVKAGRIESFSMI